MYRTKHGVCKQRLFCKYWDHSIKRLGYIPYTTYTACGLSAALWQFIQSKPTQRTYCARIHVLHRSHSQRIVVIVHNTPRAQMNESNADYFPNCLYSNRMVIFWIYFFFHRISLHMGFSSIFLSKNIKNMTHTDVCFRASRHIIWIILFTFLYYTSFFSQIFQQKKLQSQSIKKKFTSTFRELFQFFSNFFSLQTNRLLSQKTSI